MNYRSLLAGLFMVLMIVAGSVQMIRGESGSNLQPSTQLTPPLTTTFRVRIDGDVSSFILFDDKICFDSPEEHSLHLMDLRTGDVVWSYQAETKISTFQGFQRYENVMLIVLDYTKSPPSGGTHTTWPSGSGAVTAIDMDTTKELWKFPTKTSSVWDLQTRDGVVYFRSNEEGIYALNASTGKEMWFYPELITKSGFMNILLTDQALYASTYGTVIGIDPNTGMEKLNGTLVALDPRTGREMFRVDTGRALDYMVFANKMLYGDFSESSNQLKTITNYNYAGFNHSFVAFNPSTKRITWKTLLYPFSKGGELRPIVTNDSVYVTGIGMRRMDGEQYNPKRIYALGASSGRIKWSSEFGDFRRDMVQDEPYLYVLDEEYLGDDRNRSFGRINAYDTRTGEKVWSYAINRDRESSHVEAGLFCSDGTGRKTIYLICYEHYDLDSTGPDGAAFGTEFIIYGFGSKTSSEPVPELQDRPLILAISILVLVPLLLRKRRVIH